MLTVAISKRNKLQNIIVLTPKDGYNREKNMMSSDVYKRQALTLVEQGDWENAQCEIRTIEENLDGAIEWWNREEVVGKREKALVFLLLHQTYPL